MGKKKKSNGGGGGGGGGGEKKSNNDNNGGGNGDIVLKTHLHCQGCTERIRKSILGFPGVCEVSFEGEEKVKVVPNNGSIDVQKLKEKVEKKTGKKFEIVSPQPKKDNEKEKKEDKPKDDQKPKEAPVTTVVLKVAWHCYGCGEKIQKAVSSFKGVYDVSIDKEKDLVTVKGRMEVKKLVEELREKLKRPVEIVPEKKDQKEKKEKKENENDKEKEKDKKEKDQKNCNCKVDHFVAGSGFGYGYGYDGGFWGPVMDPYQQQQQQLQQYYYYHHHAPQLFSDENANACSIM